MRLNKYNPLSASTFIPLPVEIKHKHTVINIENRYNECFKYAVLSAIYPVQDRKDNAYLPNHYLPFQSNLDLSGITFPSPLRDIGKFVKNDSLSINVCLLSVFALLAVIGSFITALEYSMKEKFPKDQKCKPFFNCFCIFTNGEKILNTANSEGQLPCLHGIRFLSMNWVIILHTYAYQIPFISNTDEVINDNHQWSLVLNSSFSVDSFFILSGFLVGYSFFQKAEKTDGKTQWLYFYTHRYVRLTPVYMIVLAFYATISPFLGSGPLWPDYDVISTCKDNWWWNMLYINNFQALFYDQCMEWSWYLANDMQFYVISPLFLITLWRWPKVGYSLLGLFFCITFAWSFALTYGNYIHGLGYNSDILYISDILY
ncbi:Nose resistant to fluoxetine protein 6, partial [Araneus ventricosus]